MTKTTLTLSEPIAKALKIYTAKTKNSLSAQSKVVEDALREFFERRKVKIEEMNPVERDRRSPGSLAGPP